MNINRTVDVIIPSYYPGEKFDRLLEKLRAQTYPIKKIIIVNTEKEGLSEERLRGYENIELHHIRKEDFDHGGTRNLAVSYSEADCFLMLTDDCVPKNSRLVENLMAALAEDERIGAVYGRQLATEESSFDERFARQFNYPEESFVKGIEDLPKRKIKTFFQSDVCCLYRRDLFDRLGGFTAPAIFNEDMLYCAAMLTRGYLSKYEAGAEVYHAHHYGGIAQLHRNFDLGVSQAEHPEVFTLAPSEGEGIRMIKENIKDLLRRGEWYRIPVLLYLSGCKYIGFRLGKSYRRLPMGLVKKLSMNQNYWRKNV